MASRYQNNETKKLSDGREVYRTKIYPKIPKTDSDIYVVTQGGDRLDTLSNDFYGDSSLWWIIASANNIHDAPFALSDGTVLRIPQNYTDIISQFNK
jgi:nucleoid-associated protein YgaU